MKRHPKYEAHSIALLVQSSELLCYRFLEAKLWDMDMAVELFHQCLRTRSKKNLDHTLDRPFPKGNAFLDMHPCGFHKTTRDGYLVYIDRVGQMDLTKLKSSMTLPELIEVHYHFTEFARRRLMPMLGQRAGAYRDQCVNILDLEGLGLRQFTSFTKNYLSAILQGDQRIYPDQMRRTVVAQTLSTMD